MTRKRGRAYRQAEANAELRYGPQQRALGALVDQAKQDLRTDRRITAGTAAATIRGARESRRQLHKIYQQASNGQQIAQHDVEAAFGSAGVGADNPYALASTRETAAFRQRLTGEAARARKDTVDLENQARLGKLFGFQQARQRYQDTRAQIRDQARALGDERSVYFLSELGRLQGERAQRRNARRIALINKGIDPKTGKLFPDLKKKDKGKGDGGFDPASRSESRSFTNEFARLKDLGATYAKQGSPRKQLARNLRAGIPSEPYEENGKKLRTPNVPASRDPLALRAALDMAYKGYISDQTVRKLHTVGIRADDLPGGMTYTQWLKRGAGRAHRPVGTNNKAPF